MKGNAILLSLVVIAVARFGSAQDSEEKSKLRSYDFEDMQLDNMGKDNCGKMHKTVLNLLKKNAKHYPEIHEDFTKAEHLGCRAHFGPKYSLVRLVIDSDKQFCKVYLPIATEVLFLDEKHYSKLLYTEELTAAVANSKCQAKATAAPQPVDAKPGQTVASGDQIEQLVLSYINSGLTATNIEKLDVSTETKNTLNTYIADSHDFAKKIDQIENMTKQMSTEVQKAVMDKITVAQANKILSNNDYKVEAQEAKVQIPNKVVTESAKPIAEAGKKYLSPSQMDDKARYCNDADMQRARDIFYASATLQLVRPWKVYIQNIIECTIGQNGDHIKFVLEINTTTCLVNFAYVDGAAKLMNSDIENLPSCQQFVTPAVAA